MDALLCDFKDCGKPGIWHIEDNGAPWETNSMSCNEHLHQLCDPKRPSVVQMLTNSNKQGIIDKRAYGN